MPELSDAELWKSYSNCNTEVVGIFYERSCKKLLAYNFRLYKNDMAEGEDNVQNMFERLIAEKPAILATTQTVDNFFRWSQTYCKNRWLAYYRKHMRRGEILEELAKELSSYEEEEKKILLDNLKQVIYEEISQLDHPKHRDLLLLAWEGLDNKEIAERMNEADNWVRREKNRAIKRIVDILKRKGII